MLSNHAWGRSMARLDRIIERCMSGWREVRGSMAYGVERAT
jgi:hypothetical protein